MFETNKKHSAGRVPVASRLGYSQGIAGSESPGNWRRTTGGTNGVTVDRTYPRVAPLSPAQRAEMFERQEEIEEANEFASTIPLGPPGLPLVNDPDTPIVTELEAARPQVGPPAVGDFVLGRSVVNNSVPT